jgi:hypothetical protein
MGSITNKLKNLCLFDEVAGIPVSGQKIILKKEERINAETRVRIISGLIAVIFVSERPYLL